MARLLPIDGCPRQFQNCWIGAAFLRPARAHAPIAGTVSVAGPLTRLPDARVRDLVPLLRAAAGELTQLWPLRVRQRDAAAPHATRAGETVETTS